MRGAGPLYPKLRPGPGRSTDQVVSNQRARLIGATVELVAERGYSGVTVRGLSRLAGVSTKTFYECFRNVEGCFAATHAQIVRETLKQATASPCGVEGRLRTRLGVFFGALDDEPKAARLVLVDARSAGPVLIARTRGSERALERFIRDELAVAAGPDPVHRGIADGAAAAALHLARSRLLFGRPESVPVMADGFADWLMALAGSSPRTGGSVAPTRPVPGPMPDLADDRCFLLAAVTRLTVRDGFACLTVPAICREAGISRRSFDRHFEGISDCFLAAVESRIGDSLRQATSHAAAAGSWDLAVVRAIGILCNEFAREPGLARFALLDILAPGRPGLEAQERLVVRLARFLRQTAPDGDRPGQLVAEACVAAAIGIAAADAAAGRVEQIGRSAPAVAFTVLAPAIGAAAAERAIATELRHQ